MLAAYENETGDKTVDESDVYDESGNGGWNDDDAKENDLSNNFDNTKQESSMVNMESDMNEDGLGEIGQQTMNAS